MYAVSEVLANHFKWYFDTIHRRPADAWGREHRPIPAVPECLSKPRLGEEPGAVYPGILASGVLHRASRRVLSAGRHFPPGRSCGAAGSPYSRWVVGVRFRADQEGMRCRRHLPKPAAAPASSAVSGPATCHWSHPGRRRLRDEPRARRRVRWPAGDASPEERRPRWSPSSDISNGPSEGRLKGPAMTRHSRPPDSAFAPACVNRPDFTPSRIPFQMPPCALAGPSRLRFARLVA